ncbi:hypothetical protein U9M48_000725 [Paspalum notatum var. saurae]|uniref:Uncharacterized protein n=1 Tax=Paspalum notatum var. saurae TaxID=547442 RepID=A0AAQ3SCI5_PASNO
MSMEHVGTSPSATPPPFTTTMKPPSVMRLGKPPTTLCYSCHGRLADGTLRYLPRRRLEDSTRGSLLLPREKSPRLEAIVDYLVALNTDYNALAEELCTAKLEISRLRAQITPSMPLFNPVYYPPRKRVRYNDPTARTYIRHP